MASPRAAFRSGATDIAPILPGLVPFGLFTGVAAVEVGFSAAQAVAMSVVVYAGAAQLAAIELVGHDAPMPVVVATAAVINVRLAMYSASIAPSLRDHGARWRAGLAYLLTDPVYALSVTRFPGFEPTERQWYYLGAAVPSWLLWQASAVVGIVLGVRVPDDYGLSFAVPLIFLALLFEAVRDRPMAAAAVVGGGVSVVTVSLPLDLGLLAASFFGIAAGVGAERVIGP